MSDIDTTSDAASNEDGTGPRKPSEAVTFWMTEIAAARKREQKWRKNGHRIRALYDNEKCSVLTTNVDSFIPAQPFAILYSNTETLMPALYSATPRPVVERRFKDADPIGRFAAQAGERMLEFLVDTNIEEYETFDEAMKAATLDGLLPGRGVTCIKYDAEVVDVPDQDSLAAGASKSTPAAATPGEERTTPVKNWELVCPDSRSWDRVFFGYSKKWSRTPWIAYEEHIDKDEATRLFGAEIANKINFTVGEENTDEDGKQIESTDAEKNLGQRKTALIYQIWDKAGGRKVRYVSSHYIDDYLKVLDDPLDLTGFFNIPRPMRFVEKTNTTLPTALYTLYENQATELNNLTIRIQRIVSAIKARGIYAGGDSEMLTKLFEEDDNALVPADNSSALAFEKGLQNAIWFLPLEVLIQVLQQLYVAREACKQVIYEITGISDILRGASKASETLGAQEIKQQWGTLRIQPKQAEVQRYARDCLRMMLEIAATKFSEETWARMTGLPFLVSAKYNELKQVAVMLQQQVAAEQQIQMAQAQAAAAQGVPAQPPQPGPKAQQLQQVVQQLQTPQWSQVLAMLRDDMQRAYRIDIETNSTIQPEAAEDQRNITELLTAMGQYLNGVAPLVQSGSMPFGAAKSMLLAISRRFRFGSEVEDEINAMQPPMPPDNGQAAAAAEMKGQQAVMAEQAKGAQVQQKAASEKMSSDAQVADLQTKLGKALADNDLTKREAKLALDQLQLNSERQIFKLEQDRATEKISNKAEVEGTKLEGKRHQIGMEKAAAKHETTTKQQIAQVADAKLSDGVKAMKDAMAEVLSAVAEQSKSTGDLIKAVSAPRKRKAIRGKDGRIEATVDEVMQ